MSAIGNYVHLTAAGYSGSNEDYKWTKNKTPYSKFVEAKQNQQDAIQHYIKELYYPHTKTLEKDLNAKFNIIKEVGYRKPLRKNASQDKKDLRDFEDGVVGFIDTQFRQMHNKSFDNTTISPAFDTLPIDSSLSVQAIANQKFKLSGKNSVRKATIREWERKVDEVMNDKEVSNLLTTENYSKLEVVYQKIKQMIKAIMDTTERIELKGIKQFTEKQITLSRICGQIINSKGETEDITPGSLITALNDFRSILTIDTQAIGDALNFSLWGAQVMLARDSGNMIADYMQDFHNKMVSNNRGKSILQSSNFIKGFQPENVKFQDANGNWVLSHSTQDKVDVSFTYKNEATNISAKNHSLYGKRSGIIALQGLSHLTSYLQNENKYDFVNHYLNVKIPHIQDKDNDSVVRYQKEALEATEIVKQLLLLKAASGKNWLKMYKDEIGVMQSANVLVVNDRYGGKTSKKDTLKVIGVGQLIDYLISHPNKYLIEGYNLNSMLIDTPYKVGDFNVGTSNKDSRYAVFAEQRARIADLLQKLHQIKISVSFNYSAVYEMPKK